VEIQYRQALEFVGSLTLPSKIPEFWYPIAGIRSIPKSGLAETSDVMDSGHFV